MDSKMEQLKEGYNEEEQLETSKKRPKKNSKSFKILIFVTIISCLLNIFLFYKLFTKNDFLDLAESRFALRQFSNKTIEQEKIDKLLRVAQIVPTAENKQP